MSHVYLAGPISGLDYNTCIQWRLDAEAALRDVGIDVRSPMRNKQFTPGVIDANTYRDQQLGQPSAILARDYNDCRTSAAVLFNLLPCETASIGTAMELAWCFAAHLPTVVIDRPGSPHWGHPMVEAATNFKVSTVEDGVECIKSIIGK